MKNNIAKLIRSLICFSGFVFFVNCSHELNIYEVPSTLDSNLNEISQNEGGSSYEDQSPSQEAIGPDSETDEPEEQQVEDPVDEENEVPQDDLQDEASEPIFLPKPSCQKLGDSSGWYIGETLLRYDDCENPRELVCIQTPSKMNPYKGYFLMGDLPYGELLLKGSCRLTK